MRPLLLLLVLLLGSCQTPDAPLPPEPPVAEFANPGPIDLQRGLTMVASKDTGALRADFHELFVLSQELPYTRRLVLLRRQDRAIWRERVEKRVATVRELMPISKAYQAATAEKERLAGAVESLRRRLALRLKRPAATLELNLDGLIRDPTTLAIDLEGLIQMAQTQQPDRDEVRVAQEVRESLEDLAAATESLNQFAGSTGRLMRDINRDLRKLEAELVPGQRVDAEIEMVSTRLHGLKLLRTQQRSILALEAAIGQQLPLAETR